MNRLWYRGGDVPSGRPVWLAQSERYAAFFAGWSGSATRRYWVRGRVLDLVHVGIDVSPKKLIDAHVPADLAKIRTPAGEMHQWAARAAPELARLGYSAVMVAQWHHAYGTRPESTILVFDKQALFAMGHA